MLDSGYQNGFLEGSRTIPFWASTGIHMGSIPDFSGLCEALGFEGSGPGFQ